MRQNQRPCGGGSSTRPGRGPAGFLQPESTEDMQYQPPPSGGQAGSETGTTHF